METLASCLPMLSGQGLTPVMQADDLQTLSGAQFLQTLAALSAITAPGQAEAPLLQGLPTELNAKAEKPDEPDAAITLQWLPLTQFIESGMAPGPVPASPTPAAGYASAPALLQTAATSGATVAVASVPRGKPAAAADPAVAVPESLLPAEPGDEMSKQTAAFAETLADADTANAAVGFPEKTAGIQLTGSSALAASASAVNALHAGSIRPQSSAPMNAEQTVQAHIRAPVHSARWAEEIGQRITLMAAAGQQNGTLTLTPENMGPLEVRINVSQDTASVWFGAQQADTRAALTDALPRLREMFAANGLSLGEANVSHETPRQESEAAKAFRGEAPGSDEPGPRDLSRPAQRLSLGMIDTYA